MGNASTKERAQDPSEGYHSGPASRRGVRGSNGEPSHPNRPSLPTDPHHPTRSSRSRHNLEQTLFGLASSREARERDREVERAARELRRKEREELRQRERERSRKEESIDGGFLVTHGVYTGTEDFKDEAVRRLMIERRLSPFFKGLRDHEDDWSDAQLYAAFHDLPPDTELPKVLGEKADKSGDPVDNLTVPIASRSRSQSYTSEGSNRSNNSPPSLGFSSTRSRAKTLSISSPRNPTLANVAAPLEANNPSRFVDGRPIEAVLYKNAVECPICFMYYPPHLNRTRCCDQDICSECFVQIKRADPHIPENHDHSPGDPSVPEPNSIADQLVSEPATCPFCKQVDFGVTYSPPPFRRGLTYVSHPSAIPAHFSATANPSTSLTNPSPPISPSWKRRTMLPPSSPEVVTSDDIRPDWNTKLQTARSHAARRAAAATALHTAAFLMGGTATSSGGSSTTTGPGYGRRLIRRAAPPPISGSEGSSPTRSGPGTPSDAAATAASIARDHTVEERLANLGFISASPRERSVAPATAPADRRSRIGDLEEMMLMEAIRLSLAEEEERKRKEVEEAARKKEAEEAARKKEALKGKGKDVDRNSGGDDDDEGENAGSGQETMFNFSSLAEMVKREEVSVVETENVEVSADGTSSHGRS